MTDKQIIKIQDVLLRLGAEEGTNLSVQDYSDKQILLVSEGEKEAYKTVITVDYQFANQESMNIKMKEILELLPKHNRIQILSGPVIFNQQVHLRYYISINFYK